MKLNRILVVSLLVTLLGLSGCSQKPAGTQTFTLEELAVYDGIGENKAYIAVDGKVYDVTNREGWGEGNHNGAIAGTDLTELILSSPHGKDVLRGLTVVGTLAD